MKYLLLLVLMLPLVLGADSRQAERRLLPAGTEDGIDLYFSPEGGCEQAIVEQLRAARKSIQLQMYTFTNNTLAAALAEAHRRGVKVQAIFDHGMTVDGRYSGATYLLNHNIPVWTDGEHQIAHNKICIIDDQTIITGSFNWTRQAENNNAENLLIIKGKKKLAAAYAKNFAEHLAHSKPYTGIKPEEKPAQ